MCRCVAALLGANVILTDVDDRLRLLQKNVDENLHSLQNIGTAIVRAQIWGDLLDRECLDPLPDFGLASSSCPHLCEAKSALLLPFL